jgi:hypothetical protein
MSFDTFRQALDPDGQLDFMLPVTLNTGEVIASAVAAFVDSTSSSAASGTTPSVTSTTFGLISGLNWGVTVWVNGNSAPAADYYLRFRITTTSSPARIVDRTVRLTVKQT